MNDPVEDKPEHASKKDGGGKQIGDIGIQDVQEQLFLLGIETAPDYQAMMARVANAVVMEIETKSQNRFLRGFIYL